ncbi:unnamed protein product [marine sediment metagenome]|uniref:Uncharacterized protein n=1 Tax=marine sediment metagenome TaxID=412755 RepID=X1KG92_9ZZZZ
MPGKKRLPVPDNQLTLIPMEPELPKKHKPRVKRIDGLEERVTHLEAEVALTRGQLDREEDLDEDDD